MLCCAWFSLELGTKQIECSLLKLNLFCFYFSGLIPALEIHEVMEMALSCFSLCIVYLFSTVALSGRLTLSGQKELSYPVIVSLILWSLSTSGCFSISTGMITAHQPYNYITNHGMKLLCIGQSPLTTRSVVFCFLWSVFFLYSVFLWFFK